MRSDPALLRSGLATFSGLHAAGQSNAEHNAASARRSYEARWALTGYLMQSLLGIAVRLALLLVRRRMGAV